MEQRTLKALLVTLVGLQALVWLANNLINLPTAHGAVLYALSLENHSGYPNHLVPPIASAAAAWLGLGLVLVGEAIASVACLMGGFKLWQSRRAPDKFTSTKRYGVIGCGAAIFVWFGLFGVFGGGLLMMGQAEGMAGAVEGAFRYAAFSFLTLIYLSIKE